MNELKKHWKVIAGVAIVLYVLVPAILFCVFGKPDNSGVFGDTFGFINSIVSGCALAALVYTLNQVALMREQSFDTKFFQLMQLLQQIVEAIEVKRKSGRAAFELLYDTYLHPSADGRTVSREILVAPAQNDDERRKHLSEKYRAFHDTHINQLGHFFRTLFHIVLYIDKSSLSTETKEFYAKLVQAQLSQHQLLLLFYNCLADGLGYPKFYKLVETYDLLQNMNEADLIDPSDVRLYQKLKHRRKG